MFYFCFGGLSVRFVLRFEVFTAVTMNMVSSGLLRHPD
jgi:hypothetical protein